MKQKSLLFIAALIMSMITFAQPPGGQGGNQFDPEEMVKRQTEQMVTDLTLNADQTKKVEEINRKYGKKMNEMFQGNRDGGGDWSKMREKMEAIRTDKNAELKTVLTDDQYNKYIEIEKKRMEEMRQRRGTGNQGPPPERRGQQRGSGN